MSDGSHIVPAHELEADDLAVALDRVRDRAARMYLRKWRPTTFTFVSLAAAALWVSGVTPIRPYAIAVALGWTTLTWLTAYQTTRTTVLDHMLVVVTIVDLAVITFWSTVTTSPGEGLAMFALPIIASAWLIGRRMTLAVGAYAVATSIAVWRLDGHWSEPQFLPDVMWILIAVSAISYGLCVVTERAFVETTLRLRAAARELRETAEIRRRMAADVSHELRTPLTAINGFLDTVLRDDVELDAEQSRALIVEARRGGARLEALVGDLLEIERAVAGALRLDLATHRIGPALEDAVRGVPAPELRRADVEFETTEAADALALLDERRFAQTVGNLVGNAFTHGAGTVRVRCSLDDSTIQIDVSDEGRGLPRGNEELAFEPFASFGNASGSAGLGLAIARTFAAAHGGSLEYVRGDGPDTHAFRLRVPRLRAPV